MKEVELGSEPAMIPRPRLLQPLEVGVEILLGEERGAVDPGQLRVRRVAAPVRACQRGELDRLDRRRVLQMGPAAEIGEGALGVERDRALRGADELDLVRLPFRLESGDGVSGGDLLALPLATLGDLLADLLLERLELGVGERLRKLEVVVETVVDRWADRDLHTGMQAHRCLGEQVRRRVPQDGERIRIPGVAGREDLDLGAVGQRQPEILHHAVRADQHRLLRELRPDRAGRIDARRPLGELEFFPVGENDIHSFMGIVVDHRGGWRRRRAPPQFTRMGVSPGRTARHDG